MVIDETKRNETIGTFPRAMSKISSVSGHCDTATRHGAQQQKSYLKDYRLRQFHRKYESPSGRHTCFNGRYELVYKYTARGGNRHGMQSIRNIL